MEPLPPAGQRNEVHLVLAPNGHCKSTDCWCEPSKIYWYKNKNGVLMLVVEHEDYTLEHHNEILKKRRENPDALDRALDAINTGEGEPNAD